MLAHRGEGWEGKHGTNQGGGEACRGISQGNRVSRMHLKMAYRPAARAAARAPSGSMGGMLLRGALVRTHPPCACVYVQVLSYLYSSTGYQDELAYAAAMLFKVTGACCCTCVCPAEPARLLQW